MSEFERVIQSTGLTIKEVAYIYGVSRQTIYNWRDGMQPTQEHIRAIHHNYTRALDSLVTRGALPLPAGLDTAQRKVRIDHMKANLFVVAKPRV